MKITRKMQHQFEVRLRHALARSQPLLIARPFLKGTLPQSALEKVEENDVDHSK